MIELRFPRIEGLLRGLGDLGHVRNGVLAHVARAIGPRLVELVRENIKAGGVPSSPLHPFTVAQKGMPLPLIRFGRLLADVTFVIEGNILRVGWLNNPDAATYGSVAERGAVVRVSDKMRSYLASVGFYLKKTTTTLVIPARPILAPALDKAEDDRELASDMEDAVNEALDAAGLSHGRRFTP